MSAIVPKGQPIIARRFNAGIGRRQTQVPKGRLKQNHDLRRFQSSLRDLNLGRAFPALKRRAIFKCPCGTFVSANATPTLDFRPKTLDFPQ